MASTKIKTLGSALLVLLLHVVPLSSHAGWRFVSPMPHGRYGHGAALGPDGKIYVMGGMVFEVTEKRLLYKRYYDGEYSNLVYDPEKDAWKYLEPVPGWVITRRFTFFEPESGQWRFVRRVKGEKNYFKIDEGVKGWRRYPKEIPPEKLRNMNFERQGDGVALVTGKDGIIYWIGGKEMWLGFGEATVLHYDPVNSKWPSDRPKRVDHSPASYCVETVYETHMPPMNDRRIDHEAVVTHSGKIYVMGGYQRDRQEDKYGNVTGGSRYDVLDSVECYDPKTNKWEYKKPLSVKRMFFAAVVGPDDKIYVFGGAAGLATKRSTPILDTTEVYDPKTDTWSFRTPVPEPRKAHAGVLGADGKMYILGGSTAVGGPPLNDIFIYDPAQDAWQKGPKMNLPRSIPAAVATPDGKIYAIGGTDVGAYGKNEKMNTLLPRKQRLYTGKVQDTVEVLDINDSSFAPPVRV